MAKRLTIISHDCASPEHVRYTHHINEDSYGIIHWNFDAASKTVTVWEHQTIVLIVTDVSQVQYDTEWVKPEPPVNTTDFSN